MTIRPRPFDDADLPLLQRALATWIEAAGDCGYYHVGHLAHWIHAGLRGRPRADLVRVWQEGPEIAGIAIHGLYDTVFHVFTAPRHRGGEMELAMLRSAAETTRRVADERGQSESPISTDVFCCDQVKRNVLASLGFEEYRLWDHITERSLSEPLPDASLPPGFHVLGATPDDYRQLALVRNDAFQDGWEPEQYRDEVMRKPGYRPEHELLALAPDGRVAAFATVHLDELNRVGQFEPVGTAREFQRRGLARAVMVHGMRLMRARGMRLARVEHDAANQPAAALYRSLGFVKRYETLGYRRA